MQHSAIHAGVRDVKIRRTFFNKEMLAAARHFIPYPGYDLYTGKKTQTQTSQA
jgi:hypothetical protein